MSRRDASLTTRDQLRLACISRDARLPACLPAIDGDLDLPRRPAVDGAGDRRQARTSAGSPATRSRQREHLYGRAERLESSTSRGWSTASARRLLHRGRQPSFDRSANWGPRAIATRRCLCQWNHLIPRSPRNDDTGAALSRLQRSRVVTTLESNEHPAVGSLRRPHPRPIGRSRDGNGPRRSSDPERGHT
jgi:hypothetical protein